MDALSVMDNSEMEGFHNITVNLFDVILEYSPMLTPHAVSQVKPNLLLKVNALVQSQIFIPVF